MATLHANRNTRIGWHIMGVFSTVNSVTRKKYQIISISLALTFTSFIRLDAVVIVPVASRRYVLAVSKSKEFNYRRRYCVYSLGRMDGGSIGLSSVLPQTFVVPGGGANQRLLNVFEVG